MGTVETVAQAATGLLMGYAAFKARRASKNTEATGNGFAKKVTDSLERIERKIDNHIEAHAENDVRRN